MTDRAHPFKIDELPTFAPKPKADKPVDREAIEKVSKENNFPSRQPPKEKLVQQQPKPRRRRTGRNQQINIKTTADTIAKIYRMADERQVSTGRQVSLGEILELALAAYERQVNKAADQV